MQYIIMEVPCDENTKRKTKLFKKDKIDDLFILLIKKITKQKWKLTFVEFSKTKLKIKLYA